MNRPLTDLSIGTVIIAGAHKAGTTSLHALLDRHPDIAMSVVKETNRYCPDLWPLLPHVKKTTSAEIAALHANGESRHLGLIQDEEGYARLFPSHPDVRYHGEASPFYFRSILAAKEIFDHHPNARIIVVLRDPVERLLSHYDMEIRDARIPEPIEAAIREEQAYMAKGIKPLHGLLDSGCYGEGLSRFFQHFPAEQILVIDFSELASAERLTPRIATFLGIDPGGFDCAVPNRNESVAARSPWLNRLLAQSGFKDFVRTWIPQSIIEVLKPLYYGSQKQKQSLDPDLRSELVTYYKKDIQQLLALIGPQSWDWLKRYT